MLQLRVTSNILRHNNIIVYFQMTQFKKVERDNIQCQRKNVLFKKSIPHLYVAYMFLNGMFVYFFYRCTCTWVMKISLDL